MIGLPPAPHAIVQPPIASPSPSRAAGLPKEGYAVRFEADLEPEHMDALTGSVLAGRYRVVRLIGEGGMGLVYEARHLVIDKRVAVKVLAQDLCNQAAQVERFIREARATSKIEHENIVEITDFGPTPNGSVFFVMEYLQGEDLGAMIAREGPQTWERTRHLMLQLCAALAAAHARGIVHRDIKPQNCFRTTRHGDTDFLKMLDFGIAKLLGEEHRTGKKLTRSGQIFGTPEYMSPEQVRGMPADPRMDVYAAGVICYELLTGRTPYEGAPPLEILAKQLRDPIPNASASRRSSPLPVQVDGIIHRALAKDVADRFQSADELAAAIHAVPKVAPTERVVAASPSTLLTGARRPVKRPSAPGLSTRAGFVGGLVMFVVAGIVIFAARAGVFRADRRDETSQSGEQVGGRDSVTEHASDEPRVTQAMGSSTTPPATTQPVMAAVPAGGVQEASPPLAAEQPVALPARPDAASPADAIEEASPLGGAAVNVASAPAAKLKALSSAEIDAVLRELQLALRDSCRRSASGIWLADATVKIKMKVELGTGRVISATAKYSGENQGEAIESCVQKRLRAARFPKNRDAQKIERTLRRPQ